MSDTPFEDDLRRRFAAAEVDVPIDVPAILIEGKRSRRRQRWWTAAGVVLTVVVAVIVALLVAHTVRQAITPPEPTGGINPAHPSPSVSPSGSANPSPSAQADLTRNQFDDLVQAQMRARGFPAPDPEGSETARLGYMGTCGALGVPLVSFTRALPSQFDPSLTWVALLADGTSATDLAARAETCLRESGAWTNLTATTGKISGAATWHVSANAAQVGDGFDTDLVVYRNVLAFGDYLEGWDAFVRDTFVPAVDAALAEIPVPSSDLPPLARITVNTRLGTDTVVAEGQAAAIQRFADDVADGNISSMVANCWTQPAEEVRSWWSDNQNRANALAWLQQPPGPGETAITWQPDPNTAGFWFPYAQLAGVYACPVVDRELTVAQAALAVQRVAARYAGAPINPADTDANYPILPDGALPADACRARYGIVGLSDAQDTCGGLSGDQWAVLVETAAHPLMWVGSTATSGSLVVAPTISGDQRVVLLPTTDGYPVIIGAYREAPESSINPADALPRITVNGTYQDSTAGLSASQVAAVQRFADDLADGAIDSIVANCWTQAAADVRTRWTSRVARQEALAALVGPAGVENAGYDWRTADTQPPLHFSPDEVNSAYACPDLGFTVAHAARTIERLVGRHDGTPVNPADTEANYPLLSCDSTSRDSCVSDFDALAGHLTDAQTTKNGISDAQWQILRDLVGQPLTLRDASVIGDLSTDPSRGFMVALSADRSIRVVFDMRDGSNYNPIMAVYRV